MNFKLIEKFESLKRLSIVKTRDTSIIKQIKFPKNIVFLDLSSNNLSSEDLKDINFPPKLKLINLACNNITTINFKIPKKLKWLLLNCNKITSLSNIKLPKTLLMISVSGNLLTDSSFDKLNIYKKLRLLDISYNKLSPHMPILLSNKYKTIVKNYSLLNSHVNFSFHTSINYIKPGNIYYHMGDLSTNTINE